MKFRRGQVWVETVVYTLIAFALIGLVLSFVKPEIEKNKDQAIIKQSIDVIDTITMKMEDTKQAPGNQRILHLLVRKGSFVVDGKNDRIFFEMDESKYKYSEPGKEIERNDLIYFTEQRGEYYKVNVTKNYENYNITFSNQDMQKKFHAAPSEYILMISNEGYDKKSDKLIINFEMK